MQIDIAFATHQGRRRDTNQDTVGVFKARKLFRSVRQSPLLVVADGMGGHRGGAIASHIAVQAAGKAYQQASREQPVEEVLLSAVTAANQAVHDKAVRTPALDGMGTTIVAAMLDDVTAYVANVGDSRAYMVHGDQIEQITDDHSLVAEQVRMGAISEEQAIHAVGRNVITRALGRHEALEVDIFSVDWQIGDALVLCSDGLWGPVSDGQVLAVVRELTPQEAVEKLTQLTLLSRAPDNIGLIVTRRVE